MARSSVTAADDTTSKPRRWGGGFRLLTIVGLCLLQVATWMGASIDGLVSAEMDYDQVGNLVLPSLSVSEGIGYLTGPDWALWVRVVGVGLLVGGCLPVLLATILGQSALRLGRRRRFAAYALAAFALAVNVWVTYAYSTLDWHGI